MSKKVLMWGLGFLFLTSSLQAHDVWLQTNGDHLEVLYGDGLPEVYNPAKIKEFAGHDKKGHSVFLRRILVDEGFAFSPEPQAAMITVGFDNGYWIQASSGDWRNVTPEIARTFPAYKHAMLFHKSIYVWSGAASKPVRQKMELVPLKNPFGKHHAGDQLALQVFFDAKPLANVNVEYSQEGGKTGKVKTDTKGKAQVPYAKRPVQYFTVHYILPAAPGPETDTYAASLRFELKS